MGAILKAHFTRVSPTHGRTFSSATRCGPTTNRGTRHGPPEHHPQGTATRRRRPVRRRASSSATAPWARCSRPPASPLDLSLPELNVSRPELVKAIHGAYIAAGADIIETNTFGACRTRLAPLRPRGPRRRDQPRRRAASPASAVAASDRSVLVAGSVGPATPPSSRGRIAARRAARGLPGADRGAGRRRRRPDHLRDLRQPRRANRSDWRGARGRAHAAARRPDDLPR